MIKLVLTDLDDTLIPFGQSCASKETCAAIHEAIDAGVRVGPATGRLPADMQWMFPGEPECCATGLFAGGQIVHVDGRPVHMVMIARHLLERVQEVLDGAFAGEACLALYEPYKLDGIAYITANEEALRACPPPTWGQIKQILPRVADFPATQEDPEPGYAKANVQCSCERARMEEVLARLASEVPELTFAFPSLKAKVIDIIPGGWGKGAAARALAQTLGFAADEVAVFGDSDNDLDLMRALPNSVAVANASPRVAEAAAWHIGACADGATDEAIREVARAAREGRMPSFMAGGVQ